MNRMLYTTAALMLAGTFAGGASAESLNVTGTVAPYCNVNLTNVSSGTATIAFTDYQKIANLRLSCNSAGGAKLEVNPQNGDLVSAQGKSINYAFRLDSAQETAFAIPSSDTAPGDSEGAGKFTRSKTAFTTAVANGVPLELWMNVNVQNEGGAPDLNGNPQFPANAAPAGDYKETWTFTVNGL